LIATRTLPTMSDVSRARRTVAGCNAEISHERKSIKRSYRRNLAAAVMGRLPFAVRKSGA
jgi:hypothetical protein